VRPGEGLFLLGLLFSFLLFLGEGQGTGEALIIINE
jgi:hypothetical protein